MPATLPPPAATAPRTEPRQKMSRSATSQSSSAQQPSAPGRPRRSQSEDSSSQDIRAARAANARTKSHGAVPRAMDKPSQHADIIDQMDISGLGGGMFHHDGPFDAVAPSRNRQGKPHRAPVYAFEPGGNGPHNVPVVDKRLSPLAQATIAAMASSDGPYASANLLPTGADAAADSFPRGHRITPTRKMTLTEAWGKSEPEPFEEFSAGTIGNTGRGSARSSFDESGGYDGYSRRPNARRGESVDLPRRSKLPPPQPINLPGTRAGGTSLDEPPSSPTYASDYGSSNKEGVGRKKSILQRFRKMRENPNVPVLGGGNDLPAGYQSEGPYNPRVGAVREEAEPEVPRNQNYYRSQQPNQGRYQKPVSPGAPGEEPYILVDGATAASASREKALPPPPGAASPQANNNYFDRVAGADMSRKQSLYKKMKGAVARNGAK